MAPRGISRAKPITCLANVSGGDVSPPLQPQPDLLFHLQEREKGGTHSDDQKSIGQRDGLGSQKNLERLQVGDRKLGRCDDDHNWHAGRCRAKPADRVTMMVACLGG